MDIVPITYTLAGGGRGAERNEVIIYSWDRGAEPAGFF